MHTKKLNLQPGGKNLTFKKKIWNFFFEIFWKKFSEKNYFGKKMINFELLLGWRFPVFYRSSGPRKKNQKNITGNIQTKRKKKWTPHHFSWFLNVLSPYNLKFLLCMHVNNNNYIAGGMPRRGPLTPEEKIVWTWSQVGRIWHLKKIWNFFFEIFWKKFRKKIISVKKWSTSNFCLGGAFRFFIVLVAREKKIKKK